MPLTRLIPAFIIFVAVASLTMTLTAQYGYGKQPCILCLYQRIPFVITGLLAILALRLKPSSGLIPLIIMLCGLVYLGGGAVAVYHVGVEQHWWISGCSGTLSQSITPDDLRASLMSKPEKSCDEIDWTLFGYSMATYNTVFSSLLGLTTVAIGMQISKTRKKRLTETAL